MFMSDSEIYLVVWRVLGSPRLDRTRIKMLRPLTTIPLPGSAQTRLRDYGFIYYEDLCDDKGCNLEGKNLIRQWGLDEQLPSLTSPPPTKSALDIWQEECNAPRIVTFCKALDDNLGGGLAVGELTELCGAPGSGKTQLCLQLCVDVQIPSSFGGLGGEAVFIDTDGGFTPHRLKEVAEACVNHLRQLELNQDFREMDQQTNNFTVESVMQRIHYIATKDHLQLLAAMYSITEFLEKKKQVKLIVVDSLAFPFRNGTLDSLLRTRLLCTVLAELRKVARKYSLSVLITNHLTTKVSPGSESHLVPALGDSFGHYINTRIMLGSLQQGCCAAVLIKSVRSSELSAKFQILKSGIRDCSSV
ncbi:DNA repair protein RAD51 homolog 3 isoform X2 [Periplaneta americana]|uniref:DNA repair protein RAD51 homolog 3 isoform X2 n=1 Tax=Periplaneta americana TaxID=6978 RepID=UPI0037E73777